MRAQQFDYALPSKLIAREPTSPRDACRLMVLDRKAQEKEEIAHHRFFELEKFLQAGDMLVFNDSKVLPARILFEKMEIFLLRKLNRQDYLTLVKPGKCFPKHASFSINAHLQAFVLDVLADGSRIVRFCLRNVEERLYGPKEFLTLESEIEKAGSVPLPPYIKNSKANFQDYQTVYAQEKVSVAAPTAGLHFTTRLLKKLETKGVELAFVTLHVGAGTFVPLKSKTVERHVMHSESFEIDPATARRLNRAKREGRRIIAVGTTSVRVLESSYDPHHGFVSGIGETAIYIYPGYHWKCVDGLLTNFHLPQSTLILLTCSFGGTDLVMKAYEEAMRKRYRFYSFGDAMLIV